MRLPFRRRSALVEPVAPAGLPAERAERALVALAVHAQQLDDRLGRIEHRLAELAEGDVTVPTNDDLLEVRLHSARVSAELSRSVVELQGRIDDLAVKIPPMIAESKRQERARTLAESILDLSDALDTGPVDLVPDQGPWAATA
jgi:hypothetical protein